MVESTSPSLETFTAGDGYRWRYRRYAAVGSTRARIVCIHGIQSHGGWYENSCTRLSQMGFEVFFLDRRGSGLNTQDRGDTPSFRRLLDDLAEFLKPLHAQADGTPVFLLAISWGGKTAVALQRRHPGLVDGLVLLCPGFSNQLRTPLRQRLKIFWSALTRPQRLFPIPLNEPELFTNTPRWQQFLRADPLALREASARLLFHSVRLDGYLRFVPRFVNAPVLMLLAGQDRIIHNQAARRFVERFASTDKQVIEYPQAQHTLEFEPEPEEFLQDLRRWLEAQLASSS